MVEVFEYLKSSVSGNDLENVALIFDAMAIKSEEVYDKHKDKMWGYVDYAGIVPYDSECLATEVLVLQIVSFKRKFKCPIAYFFIDKISASIQAQLLITAINMLYNIGITVRSLTCDGTASNVAYEHMNFWDAVSICQKLLQILSIQRKKLKFIVYLILFTC